MTHRMSFGIQNDLIRYVPRGPQQTRSGVNWKSGGCGPIFQQNTMNVTYEAPTTPWDTTAGKVSLWTGVVSGGLGILAQGCQAFGLTKFPFIQRFVQSFGNQAMTYQPYGAYGMGGYTNSLGMGSPFSFGGGCTNTYGMLNTGMQQRIPTGNANYQQNLSQMYSSYKVLDNGNGTYTLTSGKGDNVKTGTYEELMKGMDGAAKPEEAQGAGAAKPSDGSTPANTPAAQNAPDSGSAAPASDNSRAGHTDTGKTKVPTAEQMKDFKGNITVHDDVSGEKGDIAGKTEITAGSDATKGYPASVKVGNYSYSFAKVENGVVWYKSENGDGQLYRLEQNSDGTYGLNQHEGDVGAGTADIHTRKKASTPTASKAKAQKAKPEKADAAAQQAAADKNTLEHMTVKPAPTKAFNSCTLNGKTYYAKTVTYVLPPLAPKEIPVPAVIVANCGGDEAKIKQYALEQMKKEQNNK